MKIFARNFRGFEQVEIDLQRVNFLVGDNSCGKSSIIYLIEAVTASDLNDVPVLNDDFSIDRYDYFSPYFDYGDVVFGFIADGDDGFGKVITVSRKPGFVPSVTKATFVSGSKSITLKKEEGVTYRRDDAVSTLTCENLCKIHGLSDDFHEVDLPDEASIAQPTSVFMTSEKEDRKADQNFIRSALRNILPGSRITPPLRALPEKYYSFRRKFSAHGGHFASMWFDFIEFEEEDTLSLSLSKFGKESGLFDGIKVRKIAEDIEDSPLIVTVTRDGKDLLLNQVGIGVSQVVPVLIETKFALSSGAPHMLIQQPELHLHPVAQAALGSYLHGCCVSGMRPVVETHSSYLIDRFRSEIASQKSGDDANKAEYDSEIIFCERARNGNVTTHIRIDEDGSLVDAPDSYHKFFVEEMMRTML
ncbi:AAA family ATPase [Sphingomonas adhaesiva]|uniref:AAA family ATPase n=1 Tax=Sphingomonas adhaesiva TaxID=28212 RepID=UPI002FF9C0FD